MKTDLTGLCRLQVQYSDLGARLIYLIFYIALVIYTLMFTWTYVKRAITMAFLTLMAPLVAITYPIDKIGDGQAQAFGIWLKEFIFNALLQPFHLIVYSIFMGAAADIATNNPIYAIMFLAFLKPAEKLLRKMFGFDKSSTAGGFAAGFGGAAAFKMLSSAINKGAGMTKNKGGGQGSPNNSVRTKENVESNDAPKGYEAFAQNNGNQNNPQLTPPRNDNREGQYDQNATAQQRMLDAYDENYGTENWDAQERDQMARDAYADDGGMQYSSDEYAQILRDTGLSEEEIRATMADDPRFQDNEAETPPPPIRQYEPPTQIEPPDQASQVDQLDQGERIRQPRQTNEPKRSIKNGFKALGKATFNGQNAKKLAKFAGRAAIRTATTGVGLTLGLAAGITGDDLDDVLTYGLAGAALGNRALGDMTLGGISGAANAVGNVAHTFAEGYYGVNEAAMRQQNKEFMKNEEMRDYLSSEFATDNDQRLSGKELNQLMDRASYYNNVGITDKSDIKKSLKLEDSIKSEMTGDNIAEEEKANLARQQAATISKIADKVDAEKLRTDEDYASGRREDFKRGLKKANANMTENELNKQADYMMKLLKQYKKID